jgi:hypothetical protein
LRPEGYHTENPYEKGDYQLTLLTEIVGLMPKEKLLRGVYS